MLISWLKLGTTTPAVVEIHADPPLLVYVTMSASVWEAGLLLASTPSIAERPLLVADPMLQLHEGRK